MRELITPLPASLTWARPNVVIAFGGSFDPVHLGHVEMAAAARETIDPLAFLLCIPAARSPFKPASADSHATRPSSLLQRAEMLSLALGNVPRSGVWTDEIDRATGDEPSYTIDTLTRLRSSLDAAGLHAIRLHLLIGADQALGFHRWREAHRIIELAEPIVMVRGLVAQARHLRAALARFGVWSERELEQWTARLVPTEPIDTSSTAIRAAITRGDQHAAARMLHPEVLSFINAHGLYRPA